MSDIRKMATISKVTKIEIMVDPKTNTPAEKIELLEINDGYKVVSQKGNYKVGDLCIYVEPESLIPNTPRFAEILGTFASFKDYKTTDENCKIFNSHMLKTIRLLGVYSQGMVFNINHFDELKNNQLKFGDSVDDILNIKKLNDYGDDNFEQVSDSQINNAYFDIKRNWFLRKFKKMLFWIPTRGVFPRYIQKTDQTNIQKNKKFLNDHQNDMVEITEKIDNSSMTVSYKNGISELCSRNVRFTDICVSTKNKLKYSLLMYYIDIKKLGFFKARFKIINPKDEGSIWHIAEQKYDIINRLKKYCIENNKNLAIQGEVGKNYATNPDGEVEFYMFSAFDIDKQRYLCPLEAQKLNTNLGGIPYVKILAMDTVSNLGLTDIESCLKYSEGISSITYKNKITSREGIVIKTINSSNDENYKMDSVKVISRSYLERKNKKL